MSGHLLDVESVERRLQFELLYAKHAPAVKAYVLRRGGAAAADDVVAEVFVVCWRRFGEIPPEPVPWLLGVARGVLSTQRRGERRRRALHERLSETAIGSSGETATALPTSAENGSEPPADAFDTALAGALAQLSEGDRELLMLIAWDGLTPTEAAKVLEIKPATARVRLMRARRRLTRALTRERSDPATCTPLSMEAPS